MQAPSDASMLGDFGDKTFRYFGEPTFFHRRNASTYEVTTLGISRERPGGAGKQAYAVKYAFGVEPLQQYLVDIGDGRLQALPFAYDTRPKAQGGGRWYHLHPDEHLKVGDELHWTAAAYNWNKNCADCHSTDLRKNYDARTDRYDTRYAEVSVGCEACHGPGSQHVEQADRRAFDATRGWSRRFPTMRERPWHFVEGRPIAEPAARPNGESIEMLACAPCHARRSDLGGSSSNLHDRYRVELLEASSYFADGQIEDEVFEYGSFAQSKMNAAGVVCGDCHEPHAGALLASGNALCHRCHSAAVFDAPRHSMHEPGRPGSACVDCHMPSRTYMGIDERRDHRLAVPRPDLSIELGVPNACTAACHRKDRGGDAWAKAAIERHFGPDRPKTFARALFAARGVKLGGAVELRAVIADETFPAIVRATALAELGSYPSAIDRDLARHARDPSPLVRRALAQLADAAPDPAFRTELARSLLSDSARSVRLEAARALVDAPPELGSGADRAAFERVRDELRASLEFNADRPEARLELARLGGDREALLKKSLELDPSFAGTYLELAEDLRARGDDRQAIELLKRGLEKAGQRPSLEHALGLALVRVGDKTTALSHLRRAHELAPSSVRFGLVYAVALHDTGAKPAAIDALERLHERFDGDVEVTQTLDAYRAER
jgi:predicted CXXCH cytochrome family protein